MASDFSRGLSDFALRLQKRADQLDEVIADGIENIGRATAAEAAKLTPRSDGPGPHIADAWKVETKRTEDTVTVRVYNDDPRAHAPIRLLKGGETTLLRILEFGSDPHEIKAKNGKALAFFWPKIAGNVVAQSVKHPGTRPYSMLRLAQVRAAIDIKKFADALRTVLAKAGA